MLADIVPTLRSGPPKAVLSPQRLSYHWYPPGMLPHASAVGLRRHGPRFCRIFPPGVPSSDRACPNPSPLSSPPSVLLPSDDDERRWKCGNLASCQTDLTQTLEHPDTRTEAAEAIRGLIEAIVLTPAAGTLETHVVRRGRRAQAQVPDQESGLQIELRGNLAAMLTMATRLRAEDGGRASARFAAGFADGQTQQRRMWPVDEESSMARSMPLST